MNHHIDPETGVATFSGRIEDIGIIRTASSGKREESDHRSSFNSRLTELIDERVKLAVDAALLDAAKKSRKWM